MLETTDLGLKSTHWVFFRLNNNNNESFFQFKFLKKFVTISGKAFAYGLLCVQSDQTLKKISLIPFGEKKNAIFERIAKRNPSSSSAQQLILSFHFRSKIGSKKKRLMSLSDSLVFVWRPTSASYPHDSHVTWHCPLNNFQPRVHLPYDYALK